MAKTHRETAHLVSSAQTGFSYANRKNRKRLRGNNKKLALKKYDPVARKHVLFEDKKPSSLKRRFVREEFLAKLDAPATGEAQAK